MTRFSQNAVVDKLNQYLKTRKRDLVLEYGYCHGLTLLWLYKMSSGKEAWFYDLIKKIVLVSSPKDFNKLEIDIEKFLAHIEWLQNSSIYTPDIQQPDLDKLFETDAKTAFSAVFTPRQMEDVIEQIARPEKMICLSSPNHTIGLFLRDNNYYLYDSNYETGEAKIFTDKKLLGKEIVTRLYTNIDIPTTRLSLQINILNSSFAKKPTQTINKAAFLQQFMDTTENAQATDCFGINALYLACENNDIETAKLLLKKNIPLNQQNHEGKTALYVAAERGYTALVNLLLEHGAKINLSDTDHWSPLFSAINENHYATAKALLQNNASLEQKNTAGLTALEFSVSEKKWGMLLLILLYTKNSNNELQKQHAVINQHKDEILNSYHDIKTILSPKETTEISNVLSHLFNPPSSQKNSYIGRENSTDKRHRFFPSTKSTTKKISAEDEPPICHMPSQLSRGA